MQTHPPSRWVWSAATVLLIALPLSPASATAGVSTTSLSIARISAASSGTTTVSTATPPAAGHAPAAQDDSLRVFLLTFGPGAAVWERFGHNAIWIHDPGAMTDIAYHYGLFDMTESGFLTRFLQGRMFYSMGAANAPRLLEAYRQAGRPATIQELALTPSQIRELQAFLEWNLLPENRGYRYDYFRDNCSTRVRDALDGALGGVLSDALASEPTPITYREEALSLTAEDALLTAGMDLGLGPLADQDITRWQLAFIPMRLRDDVRDIAVERDGVRIPLVVQEREVPALGRPDPELAVWTPGIERRWLWMLLIGLLTATVVAGLGWAARRRDPQVQSTAPSSEKQPPAGRRSRAAGIALGVFGVVWGLLTGILGLILLALWTLTDHEFAHVNENLLQANPLALSLVVLVPLAIAGRSTAAARTIALVLLAGSVLGLLLYPLPLTPQANLGIIALALPIHLALFDALRRRQPRS